MDFNNLPPPSDHRHPGRKRVSKLQTNKLPDPTVLTPDEFREMMAAGRKLPPVKLPDPEVLPDFLTGMDATRVREILAAVARRGAEALTLFEPQPKQAAFFESTAPERIFLGGNRSGKTTTAAVEAARVLTGRDPFNKLRKTDGRMIAVGKDLTHAGKVMWRKLSRADQFKMIRDPDTRMWRAFRPNDPWDREHEHLKKPAPPLIPQRMIKSIAWENKKAGIAKEVVLKTGWELTFFSSEGDPPQGWDVDYVWFDEEIISVNWYPEMAMRLIDRNGMFVWSATPQAGTEELYDLSDRAEKEKLARDRGEAIDQGVEEFHMTMLENIHLDERGKKSALSKITSDEEYAVRVEGKFALAGMRVYPEFHPSGLHQCDFFEIPPSWTRYMAVDPGVQVCGVLWAAVPPPHDTIIRMPDQSLRDFAGHVVIYDECYITRCDAAKFAKTVAPRFKVGQIEAMVIDLQMGRQTQAQGKTVAQQYSDALKAEKLACRRTSHKFSWSNPDIKDGIEAVRAGLRMRTDGTTLFVVIKEKCPKLVEEAGRYVYKKNPSGQVTDQPIGRKFHMMDTWRYLALNGFPYIKPKFPKRDEALGYAVNILMKKREKEKHKKSMDQTSSITLG